MAALITVGAIFLWPSPAPAQQAECGFTSTNDYICPGMDSGPSPYIQKLPDFSAPTGSGTISGTYTGSTGGSINTGTDYQAALRQLEAQLADDQQALEDFMADPEAYDTGEGHTVIGDTTPIELTAAQCQHDSTKKLPNGKLPVIPGAGGFGMDTSAGRGGKIIKVTNLNNSGSGSLRACVQTSGPRTCVFEVSGTIKLDYDLKVTDPYLTIAGQTAPNPGIMLKGAGIRIKTHDVLVQHLRIRVGDNPDGPSPGDRDAFAITQPDTYNVVLDHISASWAIDESGSTWYGSHDITVRNSIIGEALNDSLHPEGTHSKGFLVGDGSKNVSLLGNLWAHNYDRNPLMKGDTSAVIANNLFYNAKHKFTTLADGGDSGPSSVSIVGNIYKKGADTDSGAPAILVRSSTASGTKIYQADNQYSDRLIKDETSFDPFVSSAPIWPPGFSPISGSDTQEYVLSNAGARPTDRDPVDNRMINDFLNGTGRIIDSQSEVGGWPSLAKNYRTFDVPDNPNGDDDGDGYTNLEEVLHQYAAQVEGCI